LRRNIVHHFGCSDSLKQYNIARHHYTKSLVTATTGKWITPLSKKDATTHGIHEACDSFIVNGTQMFLRAPIVPHSIARATANSYVPGTSEFLRRNRLQERSSVAAASNTLSPDQDDEGNLTDNAPFLTNFMGQEGVSSPLAAVLLIPCPGICHQSLHDATKLAVQRDSRHQIAQTYFNFEHRDDSLWRAHNCMLMFSSVAVNRPPGSVNRCSN
jgi:hypothetical protein